MTGKDPTAFNPADPLRLWIIQVGQLETPVVFSTMFRDSITFSCTSRDHHYYNSDSESWTAQATTASGHCRGDWWYPSRCVICSFLLSVPPNPLSRPDCLWPYTRLFQTHIPSRIYTLSLSRSKHRPMSLPLPRWA